MKPNTVTSVHKEWCLLTMEYTIKNMPLQGPSIIYRLIWNAPQTFCKNQHSYTLDVSQALVTMATTIKELYVTPTIPSLLKLKKDVSRTVRSRAVAEETAEHLPCNKTHHNHMAALRYIKLTHGLVYELKKCAVEQRVNTTARHMTNKRETYLKIKKIINNK